MRVDYLKLRFENWLGDQNFSEEAFDVFREAVVCYRASAYRSALLMSYVGFLTIIRDRLMEKPDIPTGFNEIEWKKILTDICNPEMWEVNTFETIKNTKKPVFDISDDLRLQIRYWRDRRNDCAHNKKNIITYSHVESFWAFLISKQDKISVKGSIDELLNDVESFFDISKTPAYALPDKLLEKILSNLTNTDEIRLFIPQMADKMITYQNNKRTWTPRNFEFLNQLFLNNNTFLKEFIKYFVDREIKNILVEFLKNYPVHTKSLRDNSELIREIWYSLLFDGSGKLLQYGALSVYCSLLRNELIPDNQLNESFVKIFNGLESKGFNEQDYYTLETAGFFKIFDGALLELDNYSKFRLYFNDWAWANHCPEIICAYLEKAEITKQYVKFMRYIFGSGYPFEVYPLVEEMLKKSPEKITLIKKIVKENSDLKMPNLECLKEDLNEDN